MAPETRKNRKDSRVLATGLFPKSVQTGKNKKAVGQRRPRSVTRKTYERFVKIRGKPREIALGFALGIFVGIAPIMGIQTGIAIFLAALLKWSKISAALGVWITNPLSAPFVYSLTYVIGAWLLGARTGINLHPELSAAGIEKMLQKAPEVLGYLTLGGVVIGLPLAIMGYYVSYAAVIKYQKGLKDKLIRQKTRIKNTKEKIKRKIRP